LHAAELGTPFVKRGLAEAAAAAQLGDAHAGFGLSQEANDLFVAEPALLHVRHSPGLTDFSRLPWYGWWGAGQTGETINKVSDDISISSNGTTYTRTGSTVVGSDGSLFTSMGGSTSSDGSFRMGDFATGRGATFEDDDSKW
jgi:hypothetical protein